MIPRHHSSINTSPHGYDYNSNEYNSRVNQYKYNKYSGTEHSGYSNRYGYPSDFGDYEQNNYQPDHYSHYDHQQYHDNKFIKETIPDIFNSFNTYDQSYDRPKFGYPKEKPSYHHHHNHVKSEPYNHHKYNQYYEEPRYRQVGERIFPERFGKGG